jgi:hypothetical protein
VLITALFADVPGFREMYLRRLRTLMDEFVQPPDTPENERYFEAQIDAMVQQLAPDAALDFAKWGSWKTDPVTGAITFGTEGVPTWEEEVAALRNGYLPARRQHLYSQLRQVNGGRELPAQIGSPRIDFGDILASPESGNQDEEYIQLRNPNNFAVDLSGWRITGGIQHVFTPGTVLPAGGTLYVSPDLNAFRARENGPRGGQRLHVQGDYVGRLPNIGSELQLIGLDDQVVAQATATGSLTPAQQFLRISELMYNPRSLPNDGRFAAQDFEYIELVNTATTTTVELQHVALSQGVEFQFPNMTLGPGQRTVVVRNEAAFRHRHGDSISIAGQYGGTEDEWALSNAGEPLVLGLGADERIQEFTYEDDWVPSTDGDGYSMEIIDLHSDMSTWNTAAAWQASRDVDGSPGRDGSGQGDFNGDGSVNVADLTLFCAALSNNDPTYDLDGNQQVNSQDLLFLVHGLMGSTIGDVNFDRQFNSRDLVLIFQTGKFEMPAATASYVEGDWNCDGTFSTADFVFALQHSQYQVDSRPAGIVAARSSVWPSQVDAVFANVDRRPPNQLAWLERSRSFT